MASIYGDASHVDFTPFDRAEKLQQQCGTEEFVIVGDMNWRKEYGILQNVWWKLSDHAPTVKASAGGKSGPTRSFSLNQKLDVAFTKDVPGIPHHMAVFFDVVTNIPEAKQSWRALRTAKYQWHAAPSAREKHTIIEAVQNAAPGPDEVNSPKAAWKSWHLRAEAAFTQACELGLAVRERQAERGKGTLPTSRPTAQAAPRTMREGIRVRRLKRIGRKVSHEQRATALDLIPESLRSR